MLLQRRGKVPESRLRSKSSAVAGCQAEQSAAKIETEIGNNIIVDWLEDQASTWKIKSYIQ